MNAIRPPRGLQLGDPLSPGPELKGCASGPRPGSTRSPVADRGGMEVSWSGCMQPIARKTVAVSSAAHFKAERALKRMAGGTREGRLGEVHPEGGAHADLALYEDVAAVHLDDLAADGEPEPTPPGCARAVFVYPVETLEELAQVFWWDADSGVLHLYRQVHNVLLYPDVNTVAGVGVLDGVVQQVEEDLIELLGVAHAAVLGGGVEVYLDAKPRGLGLHGHQGGLEDPAQI